MTCVLGLDTAGPVIGAALSTGEFFQARVVRGADSILHPAIAELIDGVELDAVAISVGPGAFTSLRVGVATALGVALARGIPVVAIGSLEARAGLVSADRVLALLDARKSRAYAALFRGGPEPIALTEPADIPPDTAVRLAGSPFVAVGEGALVFRDLVEGAGGTVVADAGRSPALVVARLGVARLADAVPPASVRVCYVRAPDAVPPRAPVPKR